MQLRFCFSAFPPSPADGDAQEQLPYGHIFLISRFCFLCKTGWLTTLRVSNNDKYGKFVSLAELN